MIWMLPINSPIGFRRSIEAVSADTSALLLPRTICAHLKSQFTAPIDDPAPHLQSRSWHGVYSHPIGYQPESQFCLHPPKSALQHHNDEIMPTPGGEPVCGVNLRIRRGRYKPAYPLVRDLEPLMSLMFVSRQRNYIHLYYTS